MRQLAERLRAAGLRVWFDEWIIQPGDDIYLAIERGLEASRALNVPQPSTFSHQPTGRLERSIVLFGDSAGSDRFRTGP